MGYATCGSTLSQCFLVIQNKPGSGTSTTMEVISRVLGQYARATDPRTWLETGTMRSAADASPDRAALAGDTRLVYTEEPPKGAHLNESLINSFCGGGTPIIARDLHERQFEHLPHGLLVIACNRMPRFSPENEGLWRRIRLIRFLRQFTEAERAADPDIKAKLLAEAPGILNWLLEGLAAWRHHGLPPHEGRYRAVPGKLEPLRRVAGAMGHQDAQPGRACRQLRPLQALQGMV